MDSEAVLESRIVCLDAHILGTLGGTSPMRYLDLNTLYLMIPSFILEKYETRTSVGVDSNQLWEENKSCIENENVA
jgi:hypothetical protein